MDRGTGVHGFNLKLPYKLRILESRHSTVTVMYENVWKCGLDVTD